MAAPNTKQVAAPLLLAALFHSAGLRLSSGTIVVLLARATTCRSTAATGATAALFHSAGLRLGSGTILVLLARAGAAAGRAGTAATRAGSPSAGAGATTATGNERRQVLKNHWRRHQVYGR
jgi:hypothetical protein